MSLLSFLPSFIVFLGFSVYFWRAAKDREAAARLQVRFTLTWLAAMTGLWAFSSLVEAVF